MSPPPVRLRPCRARSRHSLRRSRGRVRARTYPASGSETRSHGLRCPWIDRLMSEILRHTAEVAAALRIRRARRVSHHEYAVMRSAYREALDDPRSPRSMSSASTSSMRSARRSQSCGREPPPAPTAGRQTEIPSVRTWRRSHASLHFKASTRPRRAMPRLPRRSPSRQASSRRAPQRQAAIRQRVRLRSRGKPRPPRPCRSSL